ncbi:MAG: MarR family transcriptional regulator [Halobacteriales archaeon]
MAEEAARRPALLSSKRDAMRFQILAEIADRQPAVSQGEIAETLGVTTQAVSDHLGDLVESGSVRRGGRGRYEVTKEGVDWLLSQAETLEAYLAHVTEEVLGTVDVESALATGPIEAGQRVGVTMVEGLLHASPETGDAPATAVAVTDAAPGEAVAVSDWTGVMDHAVGDVSVVVVPTVRARGSARVDEDALADRLEPADLVVAAGTEAVAVLRRLGVDPDVTFGTPGAVQEAAARGLSVVLVTVETRLAEHADRLRDLDIPFETVEPRPEA